MSYAKRTLQGELKYYRTDVNKYLAIVYKITETFPPVEILNELRNALTHLSRVGFVQENAPEDTEEIAKQLRRTHRHFERVKLDCVKLCYVVLAGKLDKDIESLYHYGLVPRTVLLKLNNIKERRKALVEKETIGPAETVADSYIDLYEEIDDINKRMLEDYPDIFGNAYRIKIKRKMIISFIIGIITSIVGGYIVRILNLF